MAEVPKLVQRDLKAALARDRYAREELRIADPDVAGYSWLVASPQGMFAIARDCAKTVIHGWFFGICRHHDVIYAFENCGARSEEPMGRIVRFELADGQLVAPQVLTTGLDNRCHQIEVVHGLLCLVDTANQAILRFTLDGAPVDVQRPFPPAARDDTSGAYLHMNSIAAVGDRIALMLHNGSVIPEKCSELAWLDREWKLQSREALPGNSCHDILEDERGVLWHCDSMAGEIMASDGRRAKVTDEMMTRGLSITFDAMLVGFSTFGPRHVRSKLSGAVVILDRDLRPQTRIELDGAPTDMIAL